MRRDPKFWTPSVRHETRADGSILVWQEESLGAYPRCITERFLHWAETDPDRIWMAQRDEHDRWRTITYGDAAQMIKSIGSSLLAEGLSEDRPLIILSGNSIEHALMALGAQHVGIPSAAIAPAYSLAGEDHAKLRDVANQLTPGMVFAENAAEFGRAIEAVFDSDVAVVALAGEVAGRRTLPFEGLTNRPESDEARSAHAAVTGDTVAKFLFTSGTTGTPKAVIQTQRMLCSNQQMVRQCFAFLEETPPVVVDWPPWNHTAAGNKVFNMVIYNGGTYYIDDGRPTPKMIDRTIRNLRDVSPTWYFNVPLGFQMLLDAMETDQKLRETFFARLQMIMYAGAGMSQPVWDRLTRIAAEMVPGGVLLTTGFGSTETGPFALMCTERQEKSGNLGIPSHGVVFKLVPQDGRLEGRIKSPSVTPGYWRDAELSAEAFDEEGFYRFGDAFKFVEEGNPAAGFRFDGRLAENFKLASGTWVNVGALRAKLTDDLKGLATDVVIAGEGRSELGALILPDWAAIRALADSGDVTDAELLRHPSVRLALAERLKQHSDQATGSATRVTRVRFVETPLDFNKGEVTDKGSVNQRAVLRHRADLVESLWSHDPDVIGLEATQT